MKFFTKELWLDAQNTNRTSELHLREKAASYAYRAQLDALRSRLSDEAFQFVCSADVHDGELLKLAIVDGSRPAPLSEAVRPWTTPRNHPVKVKPAILGASDRHVWRLLYKTVRRVVVDYPTEHPLFYQRLRRFGIPRTHGRWRRVLAIRNLIRDRGGSFVRVC